MLTTRKGTFSFLTGWPCWRRSGDGGGRQREGEVREMGQADGARRGGSNEVRDGAGGGLDGVDDVLAGGPEMQTMVGMKLRASPDLGGGGVGLRGSW